MIAGLKQLWQLWQRWQTSQRWRPSQIQAQQLLAWLDNSPQGLLVLDPWNRLQHLNGRAKRLLRIDPHQASQGRYLLEVVRCYQLEEAVQAARSSGRQQQVNWIYTAVSASPLHPEPIKNEPLEAFAMPGERGWVGVFLQSRQSLEALQQQQERWVSDVAHELRTPLTALGLVTESLALSPNKKQSVQIERLQRELNRLQQLVSDLLELSRLENKSLSTTDQPQSVELHELVIQAWQSLVPLAEQRGVDLVLDSAGQHRVWGDAARLHRVVLNLLDNALRFSPNQGEIQVHLYREGNWQRLEVRDQGEGFSDEDLKHMFERFYRGDPSRSRGKRVGSGLGLAIVDQIICAHGGRIRARNHLEGGAQLLLDLPKEP